MAAWKSLVKPIAEFSTSTGSLWLFATLHPSGSLITAWLPFLNSNYLRFR